MTRVMRNQFARRNLTIAQRCKVGFDLEPLIAARAKEKQREGGRKKGSPTLAEAPIDTRDEVAAAIGVSHGTYAKAKTIEAEADDETKARVNSGEESIDGAHKKLKAVEREEKREARRAENVQAIQSAPDARNDSLTCLVSRCRTPPRI